MAFSDCYASLESFLIAGWRNDAAPMSSTIPAHVYEVRPRKDKRGVDLISDALPFGRLWHGEPNAVPNAIGYATFRSRSHNAVIRVYDEAGNMIETHEHAKDNGVPFPCRSSRFVFHPRRLVSGGAPAESAHGKSFTYLNRYNAGR